MKVTILERKKGVFRLRIERKDDAGKRIFAYETVKGTAQDAERRKLELLVAETNGEAPAVSGSVTLREYAEQWIVRRAAKQEIGASTVDNYKFDIERGCWAFGDIRLKDVTRDKIEAAHVKLLTVPYKRKALVVRTVRQIHDTFARIYDDAVLRGNAIVNPFRATKRPKKQTEVKADTIYQPALEKLLEALKDDKSIGPLMRFAIATGCRRGEICGLRWEDINWEQGAVRIVRVIAQTKTGKVLIKEPKSLSSKRTIAVPKEVLEELRFLYQHRISDYVFSNRQQTHRSPAGLSIAVGRLLGKFGLGQFSLHDLRHAHATLLLQKKHNPKAVSRRLGHSDIGITLRIYGHVMPQDDDSLADEVGRLLA